MNNDRLANLKEFLDSNPEDPFNWYALGIEFKGRDVDRSLTYFNHLLTHFPDYLPSYYQAAELFAAKQEMEKAENVLKKGIALAKKQNNRNTLRELQNELNNLYLDEG